MTRHIALNFHGIGAPQRTLEPGEAPYWISEEQFQWLMDQVAAAPDPARFIITFDDSNLSDHDIALPILRRHGLRARVFVLTDRIGTPGSLDVSHIHALQEAGMVIGSHGKAHLPWPTLDQAALEDEVQTSRARLEDICGRPVTEVGIPFGRYDARVLKALHRAGYTAAWTSDGGQTRTDTFLRPRTSLRGDMSEEVMQAVLSGAQPLLRRFRRALGMMRRRWMVTG